MHRIHAEFTYDPTATDVATPVDEVLRGRRGVCQDFAHVQLACLRAFGLAARYVSGYLVTHPPADDDPALVGADASHAWVSVRLARRRLAGPGSDERRRADGSPRRRRRRARLRRRHARCAACSSAAGRTS